MLKINLDLHTGLRRM